MLFRHRLLRGLRAMEALTAVTQDNNPAAERPLLLPNAASRTRAFESGNRRLKPGPHQQ